LWRKDTVCCFPWDANGKVMGKKKRTKTNRIKDSLKVLRPFHGLEDKDEKTGWVHDVINYK
jgi:hypothetical protein